MAGPNIPFLACPSQRNDRYHVAEDYSNLFRRQPNKFGGTRNIRRDSNIRSLIIQSREDKAVATPTGLKRVPALLIDSRFLPNAFDLLLCK